jgi:methylmalonyl-CoA carboxyltransferase 12S subunit
MALSQTMTWLIAAGLVIAGWIALYLASQRKLKRAVEELRGDMEKQISAAVALVRTTQRPAATVAAPTAPPAADMKPACTARQEVSPEVLVVIAAAVTAFLGKKVRIRSAKLLETPYELINRWAQQGRVVIQASHNLRQRSH